MLNLANFKHNRNRYRCRQSQSPVRTARFLQPFIPFLWIIWYLIMIIKVYHVVFWGSFLFCYSGTWWAKHFLGTGWGEVLGYCEARWTEKQMTPSLMYECMIVWSCMRRECHEMVTTCHKCYQSPNSPCPAQRPAAEVGHFTANWNHPTSTAKQRAISPKASFRSAHALASETWHKQLHRNFTETVSH